MHCFPEAMQELDEVTLYIITLLPRWASQDLERMWLAWTHGWHSQNLNLGSLTPKQFLTTLFPLAAWNSKLQQLLPELLNKLSDLGRIPELPVFWCALSTSEDCMWNQWDNNVSELQTGKQFNNEVGNVPGRKTKLGRDPVMDFCTHFHVCGVPFNETQPSNMLFRGCCIWKQLRWMTGLFHCIQKNFCNFGCVCVSSPKMETEWDVKSTCYLCIVNTTGL